MKRNTRGVLGLVLALLATLLTSGVVAAAPMHHQSTVQVRRVQVAMGTIKTYDVNGHLLKTEQVPLSEIEQRAAQRMHHKQPTGQVSSPVAASPNLCCIYRVDDTTCANSNIPDDFYEVWNGSEPQGGPCFARSSTLSTNIYTVSAVTSGNNSGSFTIQNGAVLTIGYEGEDDCYNCTWPDVIQVHIN